MAAFGAFLNGLTLPLQALVRVQPVDLEGYLQRLEGHARRKLGHDLAILAHDHLTYLQRLGGQRALLERCCYWRSPPPAPAPARSPGPAGRPWTFSAWRRPRRGGGGGGAGAAHRAPPPATTPPLAAESARRQPSPSAAPR